MCEPSRAYGGALSCVCAGAEGRGGWGISQDDRPMCASTREPEPKVGGGNTT